MTPTPEQVAQWAREAGLPVSDTFGPMVGACPVGDLLQIICTRAYTEGRAEQAEEDLVQLPVLIRKGILALPRYSFLSPIGGGVSRFTDTSGRWIEYDLAAGLCEPEAVDAALKEKP